MFFSKTHVKESSVATDKCVEIIDNLTFCVTKVNDQNYVMTDEYGDSALGFCHSKCNGEVLEQNSVLNRVLVILLIRKCHLIKFLKYFRMQVSGKPFSMTLVLLCLIVTHTTLLRIRNIQSNYNTLHKKCDVEKASIDDKQVNNSMAITPKS